METLIIKIDTADHAMQVANFLKTVPYIKSVVTEKQSKKTSTIDWALPGRAATEKELEDLAKEMENDEEGEDVEVVFNRMKKRLKK